MSNAPAYTVVAKLAQWFWIERAFQDAKSHIGMAQYQARKWQSWHSHMALVMMAMQFMLQTRLENVDAYPFLSCCDIQILLATTLPGRRDSEEEVMRQLQNPASKTPSGKGGVRRLELTWTLGSINLTKWN